MATHAQYRSVKHLPDLDTGLISREIFVTAQIDCRIEHIL
jgi:hypothetical protein